MLSPQSRSISPQTNNFNVELTYPHATSRSTSPQSYGNKSPSPHTKRSPCRPQASELAFEVLHSIDDAAKPLITSMEQELTAFRANCFSMLHRERLRVMYYQKVAEDERKKRITAEKELQDIFRFMSTKSTSPPKVEPQNRVATVGNTLSIIPPTNGMKRGRGADNGIYLSDKRLKIEHELNNN